MVLTCLSAATILLCASFPAAPSFQNGGFEQLDSGAPTGWNFSCSNGCQGTLAIDSAAKSEGAQSVRLSSKTDESPHVYCGLVQTVGALVPGTTYRFSLKAKGEDVGTCWFGGGPDWAMRFLIPAESFDWQKFEMDWTCPPNVSAFEFRINVDSTTTALWIDDVGVAVAQPEQQAADPATADKALALIAQQEERIPHIGEQLDAAAKDGVPVPYPKADLTLAKIFCGFCRDDVNNDRVPRALEVAREVKDILDRAEGEMRKGVDVPVLKKDAPIDIRDGSFWADCIFGGVQANQPVFLTGYGHFPRVVEDLPVLSASGINVIQIEIGPNSIVFEDGVRTDEITKRILPALDRARDNGVRVCLLISPHYFPQWAYDKWPELAIKKPGFLKNTVDAPKVREIYRKHLETLIPLIKDHPALQSICLSNEPVSQDSQNDPFRLPLWRAYIERKHKSIETLNALYGTQYASFAEVPHPVMKPSEKPAILYDGVRFNQECFAEWHAWMTGIIRAIAPGLPCHAKVMLLPADRGTVFWGTDPWDFARLSQINGNDCSFMQAQPGSSWASGWNGQNMYYDLQRSMKRVPIFNTENHIIHDREEKHIEPSHIYTAIWQGAVHGQGASATWVWDRTYDRKGDFEGSILHRPSCAAAMSRCALDLMRCAREVAAVQNIMPRVALLYSNAATIWDSPYVPARTRIYEALNFCGIPIGFITDEQIAAGELDKYACLIVTGASHSTGDAIETIRKYAKGGGCLIAYGAANLNGDEYGRPVEPPPFTTVIETMRPSQSVELRDALRDRLNQNGLGTDVIVRTPQAKLPYGVEWRSATLDGKRIINLINYKRATQDVNLPDGIWTDIISGLPLRNPVTLQADTPVLAVEGLRASPQPRER
jgi:hypothetical protein